MKILLADDEALQLKRLEGAVKSVLPEAEIYSYTNPLEAYEQHNGKDIDIAFLDISMPGLSGIQLAKKLKANNPTINVIFVTAYEDYALESFKIHASGYVLKPVNASKIKEEMEMLRHPIGQKSEKKIVAKCFGNFEVFCEGKPINFSYKKSKEVFAYLVDREGAAVTMGELNAVLWEEDHNSYLRNLIADIQTTLKGLGADDVFIKRHSECYIDVTKIDCDAYQYKANDPNAINLYRGEYMIQYSWPMFEADY